MISLERPTAPALLKPDSTRRLAAEKVITDILDAGNTPKSEDFRSLWGDRAIRERIWRFHHGRCCFCERYRDVVRESDIEHFRPKAMVMEKSPTKPGYWWLAYDWSNLFFSCKSCNQEFKKNHFPIQGTRATVKGADLDLEEAVLLDPCKEQPEDSIDYDIRVEGLAIPYGVGEDRERANKTINICGLERDDLNLDRGELVSTLQSAARRLITAREMGLPTLAEYEEEVRNLTKAKDRKHQFIGLRRAVIRDMGLHAYVSLD